MRKFLQGEALFSFPREIQSASSLRSPKGSSLEFLSDGQQLLDV